MFYLSLHNSGIFSRALALKCNCSYRWNRTEINDHLENVDIIYLDFIKAIDSLPLKRGYLHTDSAAVKAQTS